MLCLDFYPLDDHEENNNGCWKTVWNQASGYTAEQALNDLLARATVALGLREPYTLFIEDAQGNKREITPLVLATTIAATEPP